MTDLNYQDLNIELDDLQTDTVTLNPAERKKLRRSVQGRFFNWLFCTESTFGASLITPHEWLLLATTPPGWIIAGVSFLTGVIGAGFRYVSFKKTLLTERRERIQGVLRRLQGEYKKTPHTYIEDLWKRTQHIDDLAIRAKLQIRLLECPRAESQKESKDTSEVPAETVKQQLFLDIDDAIRQQALKQPQIELQRLRLPEPRFTSYQALCKGELTPENQSSMKRTATGTFFNTTINLLGVVGAPLILLLKGAAAFTLLGIGLTGWGIIGAAVIISAVVAVQKYRSSSRRESLVEAAQTSAVSQIPFNELEFQRYCDLISDKSLKGELENIWKAISKPFNNNFGEQAAKANLQSDFLADLKLLKNNPKSETLQAGILTKWKGIDLKLKERQIGSLEIETPASKPKVVTPAPSKTGVLGHFTKLFSRPAAPKNPTAAVPKPTAQPTSQSSSAPVPAP